MIIVIIRAIFPDFLSVIRTTCVVQNQPDEENWNVQG